MYWANQSGRECKIRGTRATPPRCPAERTLGYPASGIATAPPMFGLFKSRVYFDSQIGEVVRSRGLWRGAVTLGSSDLVPLAISGPRAMPDAEALQLARSLPSLFDSMRSTIADALFEHYLPYAEAVSAGELPPLSDGVPKLSGSASVWPHVSLTFASVRPLDGILTTELGYAVAWDEEHTLGVRFQRGKFVELCGSVLSP